MARKKVVKEVEQLDNVFTTRRGISFECQKPDFVLINTVSQTVVYPEAPTYETKIGLSGKRTQVHPLDEKVVEQSPEYKETWLKYQAAKQQAETEESLLVLRATFLTGTIPPEIIDDPAWKRRQKLIGVSLPEDREELWMYYLFSGGLDEDEMSELFLFVMKQMPQVSPEVMDALESTFRATIQANEGSARLDDAEADPGDTAEGEMVA